MQLTVIPDHPGFLLALLPPGAFISLGLLIAGRNWLDTHRLQTKNQRITQAEEYSNESS
jgi:electron transport complex protein RnfE